MSIRDVADAIAASGSQPMRLRQGKVASVGTGTVDITIGGSAVVIEGVRYLASYTPAADDVVFILADGRDLFVLGALA